MSSSDGAQPEARTQPVATWPRSTTTGGLQSTEEVLAPWQKRVATAPTPPGPNALARSGTMVAGDHPRSDATASLAFLNPLSSRGPVTTANPERVRASGELALY